MTEAKIETKADAKADAKMFTITSSEKKDVKFDYDGLIAMSQLISKAVKKDQGATAVEFNAKAAILELLSEYVRHHAKGEENFAGNTLEAKLAKWDDDFIKKCRGVDPYLIDISTAADGLNMDTLVKKLAYSIALYATEKTDSKDPSEIAELFMKLYKKNNA